MFTIDGITWQWPCKIIRTSEVKSSDISGMMMDKSWFNDVLGQYLSYDITIAPPIGAMDVYAQVYELINAPVDGHRFILPYNNGTVEVTARVGRVADECVRMPEGRVYWKGLRFTLTANHPTRTLTLGEAITRGRAPLPEAADPAEGDTYTWHDGAWEPAQTYADADEILY